MLLDGLLLLTLCVGAPFEDVQARFVFDLPAGWTFTPQPGDIHGATFVSNHEGLPATASVHVLEVTRGMDASAIAARVASASKNEPGFKSLAEEPAVVGGAPAYRRRFVVNSGGDPRWPSMVEQRIVVSGSRAFVVQVSTLAESWGSFDADFEIMFKTFLPGLRAERAPAAPLGLAVAMPKDAPGAAVVGQWEGAGHVLQLSPSGVVVLDNAPGRYQVKGGLLILKLGSREVIYGLDVAGDFLTLSGTDLSGGKVILKRKK